jgi:hypothetical protein
LLCIELILARLRRKRPQSVEVLVAHATLTRSVEGLLVVRRADADESRGTACL